MHSFFKKINWPAFLIIVIYPILLLSLGINYWFNFSLGKVELILLLLGYYGANISVGVGLHRLWAHNTFKTNKIVEFILVLLSAGTLQGPSLAWASDHYKHHTFTDKEADPHSPFKFKGKLKGFFWSHIGWMLTGEASYKHISKLTLMKHGNNKLLKWQLKYYWQIATLMNLFVPILIGYMIGGTLKAAYCGFLFIGIGRALQQQATFCVNSLCHFIGAKKYYKGTAGDIWWMALFLLGENWHNFHHAFPADYRNGAKWYHFDVHKWIIFIMYKLGLAWDLGITSKERILAKINDTKSFIEENHYQQLVLIRTKAINLAEHLKEKLVEVENSSVKFKKNLQVSLLETQDSLASLVEYLTSNLQLQNISSKKLLKIAETQIKKAEKSVYNLYQKIENSSFIKVT